MKIITGRTRREVLLKTIAARYRENPERMHQVGLENGLTDQEMAAALDEAARLEEETDD